MIFLAFVVHCHESNLLMFRTRKVYVPPEAYHLKITRVLHELVELARRLHKIDEKLTN